MGLGHKATEMTGPPTNIEDMGRFQSSHHGLPAITRQGIWEGQETIYNQQWNKDDKKDTDSLATDKPRNAGGVEEGDEQLGIWNISFLREQKMVPVFHRWNR